MTPPAAWLRSGIPGSLRDAVRLAGDITGEGKWWNLWGDLQRCVMTGEPEFDRVYATDFYAHLAVSPVIERARQGRSTASIDAVSGGRSVPAQDARWLALGVTP